MNKNYKLTFKQGKGYIPISENSSSFSKGSKAVLSNHKPSKESGVFNKLFSINPALSIIVSSALFCMPMNLHSDTLGSNASSSGSKSLAIGASGDNNNTTKATGEQALAVGNGSQATASQATAIGNDTRATGYGGVAIGGDDLSNSGISSTYKSTTASGIGAVAVGGLSIASANKSTALGANATATGTSSLAMMWGSKTGEFAMASCDGGRQCVSNVTGSAENAIAIGVNAWSKKNNTIALGTSAQATDVNSIAIGENTKAYGNNSLAIMLGAQTGASENSTADNAIAIGKNALGKTTNTIALGSEAKANTENAIAIGNNAIVNSTNSVAIGSNSLAGTVNNVNGSSYYTIADFTSTQSVQGTTANSVFSIGDKGKERQIQNVAAGLVSATSTDAINGSQLYATAATLKDYSDKIGWKISDGNNNNTKITNKLDNQMDTIKFTGSGATSVTLDATNKTFTISTPTATITSDNNGTFSTTNGTQPASADDVVTGLKTLKNLGLTFGADTGGTTKQALGSTLNINAGTSDTGYAGTNLKTKVESGKITIGMKETPSFNSITLGNVSNKGNLTFDENGLKIDGQEVGNLHYVSIKGTDQATGSNYQNDGASGANAIAIGVKAKSTSDKSVAIGNDIDIQANNIIALGSGIKVDGLEHEYPQNNGQLWPSKSIDAILIGNGAGKLHSKLYNGGDYSKDLQIGAIDITGVVKDTQVGPYSISMGTNSLAAGDFSMAIGSSAIAQGNRSMAIGNNNLAGNTTAIASTATKTQVYGEQSIGIGTGILVTAKQSVALGNDLKVFGVGAIGIGGDDSGISDYWPPTVANGDGSVAIGTHSQAIGKNSLALGADARAGITSDTPETNTKKQLTITSGEYALAIMAKSKAQKDKSIAIGFQSDSQKEKAIAIGDESVASLDKSVAIGSESKATTLNTSGNFVYMPDGSTSNQSVAAKPVANTHSVFSVGDKGKERQIQNVAAGRVSADSTDAINGSQLHYTALNLKDYSDSLGWNIKGTNGANTEVTNKITKDKNVKFVGSDGTTVNVENSDSDNTTTVTISSKPVKYFSVNSNEEGNKDSNGATANNAIAIGPNASSSSEGSIVVGNKSKISDSINSGIFGNTNIISSANIDNTNYSGAKVYVVGDSNTLKNNTNTSVFGMSNTINHSLNTQVLGNENQLIDKQESATSRKGSDNAQVIGNKNILENATGSVIIGDSNQSKSNSTIIIGNENNTAGSNLASVIGSKNTSSGAAQYGILGYANTVNRQNSYAIGNNNNIAFKTEDNEGSFVLGNNVKIENTITNSVFLGSKSTMVNTIGKNKGYDTNNAFIDGATTTGGSTGKIDKFSIGIGNKEIIYGKTPEFAGATSIGGVSVGYAGGERRIMNVAAGEISPTSTDAVNGSQLYAVALKNYTPYFSVNSTKDENYKNDGAKGTDAIAIGNNSIASLNDSIAIGSNSQATTLNTSGGFVYSTGLANNKEVTTKPVANTHSVFSVGDKGKERQIQNVAAGVVSENSTDAINGSQLWATATNLKQYSDEIGWSVSDGDNNKADINNRLTTANDKQTVKFISGSDKTISVTLDKTNIKEPTIKIATKTATISDTKDDKGNYVLNTGDSADSLITAGNVVNKLNELKDTGLNFSADDYDVNNEITTVAKKKLGDRLEINSGVIGTDYKGDNLTTSVKDGKVVIGFKDKPTFSEVTVGDTANNNLVLSGNSIQGKNNGTNNITGISFVDNNTVSLLGNNSGVKLSNVAAGAISDSSLDAINGKQLFSLGGILGLTPDDSNDTIFGNPTFTALKDKKGSNIVAANPISYLTAINNITGRLNDGIIFNGNSGNDSNVAQYLGSKLSIVGSEKVTGGKYSSNNITTDYTKDDEGNGIIKISMSDKPKFDEVTAPLFKTGDDANSPSMSKDGIDAGNKKITNVADGEKDTDAINKKQFDDGIKKLENLAAAAKTEVKGTGSAIVTNYEEKDGHTVYNVHVDKVMQFIDKDGNTLTKIDGKFYKVKSDGTVDKNTEVPSNEVLIATVNPDGSSITPTKITNVDKGIIAGDSHDTVNGSQLKDLGDKLGLSVNDTNNGFKQPSFVKVNSGNKQAETDNFKDAVDDLIIATNKGVNYDADNTADSNNTINKGLGEILSITTGEFSFANKKVTAGTDYTNKNIVSVVKDGKVVIGFKDKPIFSEVTAKDDKGSTTINGNSINGKDGQDAKTSGIEFKENEIALKGKDDDSPVKITNVADGVNDNDAINKKQFDDGIKKLENLAAAAKTEVVSDDSSVNITEKQGDNKQTIYDLSVNKATLNISPDGKNITSDKKDNAFVTGENVANIVNKATASARTEVIAGKNVDVIASNGADGHDIYDINVSGDLTEISSIANGATKISLDKDKNEVNVNNAKITNVTDGDISETSKDAINGSQIHALKNELNKNINAAKTEVVSNDGSVNIKEQLGKNNQTIYDLSVVKSELTISDDGKTITSNTPNNAFVTGDNVANIVNKAVASARTEVKDGINTKVNKEIGTDGHDIYKVDVKGDLEEISSIANGDTKITLGKDNENKPLVDVNNAKITNIANGDISKGSKDAVTGGQLFDEAKKLDDKINNSVAELDKKVAAAKTEVTGTGAAIVTETKGTNQQTIYNVHVDKPIQFTTADGTQVTKVGDKFYKLKDGKPDETSEVNPKDIIVSMVNPDGTSTTPTKLTNLDKGKIDNNSKDAINGSQLKDLGDKLGLSVNDSGDGFKAPTFNNVLKDEKGNDKQPASPQTVTKAIDDIIDIVNKGLNFAGNTGNGTQNLGSSVNVVGSVKDSNSTYSSNNITTTYVKDSASGNGTITIEMKENPTFAGSVTSKEGFVVENGPSMTKDGINAGDKKITNVANGTNPNDAANISQIKDVVNTLILGASYDPNYGVIDIDDKGDVHIKENVNIGGTGQNNVNDAIAAIHAGNMRLNDMVNKNKRAAEAGIANALAVGNLPQSTIPGKGMLSIGYGAYKGQSAAALGISKMSDSGKWVFKGAMSYDAQKSMGAAASVGFHW